MRLRVLCVVMIVVGCGSEPTKPAAPAAKAASQRFRLPEGVLAVLDVDIPRLRASALWYLARQVMERQSTLASVCPEVIESAHGVTVALRITEERGDHPPPSATFAIVHGADAARARACLTRAVPGAVRDAAASPAAPVVAKDRPPECQIADHRWAFATQAGDAVVIQDVATGEIVQRIATGAPVEPGMVALTGDASGHLVLVYGGATARAHTLTTVDVARGSLTSFTAPPECPAPAPGGP